MTLAGTNPRSRQATPDRRGPAGSIEGTEAPDKSGSDSPDVGWISEEAAMLFALLVIGFVVVLPLVGLLLDRRTRRRSRGLGHQDVATGMRRVRGQADSGGAGGGS